MIALVEKIASQGGATRQQLRDAAAKPKAGRPKALRLRVPAADQGVQPEAQFRQEPRVERDEIIDALESIIRRAPQESK